MAYNPTLTFNSNSTRTGLSQFNSDLNSGIGIGIGKKIQFRNAIYPNSGARSLGGAVGTGVDRGAGQQGGIAG